MLENPLRASDLRIHNQSMVLSRIHASGEIGLSQSEIVLETGLKAPTIFRVFTSLEEQGLILPKSHEESEERVAGRKGRKPILYTVNKNSCYTIGLEFWTAFMSFGFYNFLGERIFSKRIELSGELFIETLVDMMVTELSESIDFLKIDKAKIIGLGIASPGQVDLINKHVVSYPSIRGINKYPLVSVLEERLQIHVILQNNCSALGFGEFYNGGFEHEGSLFTFLLRSGVNGSFINNGEIYSNSQGLTIETGHLPISLDGPRCSCGMRGCLQAYLRDLNAYTEEKHCLLFENLEEAIEAENAAAIRIIERASSYIYTAMKSIIRLLAPKSFLIVACSSVVAKRIADEVRRLIEEPDVFVGQPPRIFSTGYDPFLATKGASDLVLLEYFNVVDQP